VGVKPPQTVLLHAADTADGVGSTAAATADAAGSVVVGSARHSHVGGSMVLLLEPAAA
jgi:NADPH:quinone reductase-like Zn-dependent oxidoreductase